MHIYVIVICDATRCEPNKKDWTYFPEQNYIFHRPSELIVRPNIPLTFSFTQRDSSKVIIIIITRNRTNEGMCGHRTELTRESKKKTRYLNGKYKNYHQKEKKRKKDHGSGRKITKMIGNMLRQEYMSIHRASWTVMIINGRNINKNVKVSHIHQED